MIALKIIIFCATMLGVSFLLGNLIAEKKGIAEKLVLGFCIMLAITQLFGVLFTLLGKSLSLLLGFVLTTICVLAAYSLVKLILEAKENNISIKKPLEAFEIKRFKLPELIILGVFVAFFVYQLVFLLFYQFNVWSFDDATYVADSLGMVENNNLYTDYYLNNLSQINKMKYAITSIMPFEAMLSVIYGVNVASMVHTVFPVFLLIMDYCAFYCVSKELFKKQENRLLFLLLVSVINVFGFFSQYSLTFRLLGVPWQGKSIFLAFVATVIFAFVLKTFKKKKLKLINCFTLTILSIAACACTSTAALVTIVEVLALSIVFFLAKPSKKYVLYAFSGCIMPGIYVLLYAVGR